MLFLAFVKMEFFGRGAHVYNAYCSLLVLFMFTCLVKHFSDKDSIGTVYWLKNLFVFLTTVMLISICAFSIMSFDAGVDVMPVDDKPDSKP